MNLHFWVLLLDFVKKIGTRERVVGADFEAEDEDDDDDDDDAYFFLFFFLFFLRRRRLFFFGADELVVSLLESDSYFLYFFGLSIGKNSSLSSFRFGFVLDLIVSGCFSHRFGPAMWLG